MSRHDSQHEACEATWTIAVASVEGGAVPLVPSSVLSRKGLHGEHGFLHASRNPAVSIGQLRLGGMTSFPGGGSLSRRRRRPCELHSAGDVGGTDERQPDSRGQ